MAIDNVKIKTTHEEEAPFRIASEGERVFDQKLIHARAVGLVVSERELNFSDVLGHEPSLDTYPAAVFDKNGAMRVS